MKEYTTNSPEETFELAKQLAEKAVPGSIITLSGSLGVGKTVFAKGYAAGLGIKTSVSSPTFTIMNVYDEGRIPLYHFDVYRVETEEEMYNVGYEEYFYGNGVCLIEWPEKIKSLLPESYLKIHISRALDKDYDYRKITVEKEGYGIDLSDR
ncbi:tRNA threonylcarbamoyladenosine biosynthesis protein TsaE [Lachnospiraceae bacterium RM5]|nr:tRNA threonylcarbamoyladenosine biosynthesis protein TsaE [Lachnospiraceae bacterium RM5]